MDPETGETRPPLSIIVPTRTAWPALSLCLDTFVPQALETGSEILVMDGTGQALGDDVPSCVRHIVMPDADIFEMRARGLVESRGEIVAITEDHCIAAPDFCANTIRVHREDPRPVVAGPVVNGSFDSPLDRANFLMVHGDNLPELVGSTPHWAPTGSNISIKRDALPKDVPATGWLDIFFARQKTIVGEVVVDPSVVVAHVQSIGLRGAIANQFYAGKGLAGMVRPYAPPKGRALWYLRNAADLPRAIVKRSLRAGKHDPHVRDARRLLPIVVPLSIFGSIGIICGAIVGAGRSSTKLR